MVTEKEIIAAVPRFNNPKRNWSGLCEAAIWNLFNVLGTSGPSSASATVARKRSKIEGPGFGPGDNVVWWSGVWGYENGKQVDFGHVAYHLGNGWGFMASSQVTSKIDGFTNIGFVDLARYEKRFPNMKREGWSYDHATARMNVAANTSDATPLPQGDDDVSFADRIKHNGIDASAAVVLADTLVLTQQNAKKLDSTLDKLNDSLWIKHSGIDAPTDVVAADALLSAQQANGRLDRLEATLNAIATKLGA